MFGILSILWVFSVIPSKFSGMGRVMCGLPDALVYLICISEFYLLIAATVTVHSRILNDLIENNCDGL
jgi:hypothetical protein